jgi:hypothetical protein
VAFVLPRDKLEVRYVGRDPKRGDRVRNQSGEYLIVTDVDRDAGGVLATCVTPPEYARRARRDTQQLRVNTQTARVAPEELRRGSRRALSEHMARFVAGARKRLAS